jgi:AcrR family transcriptional regulator
VANVTDGTDSPGLRERKKRETRLALSQATIRLCVQRGWAAVTIEDIADAANVSVRTFRNYFSGKAEAVAASHLERTLRIGDELRARPVTEPLWDAVANAVEAQYAAEADPEATPEAIREHARAWRDGIWRLFAEPAVQGEILRADAAAREELALAIAERTGADVDRDLYPRLLAAVVGVGSGVAVGHWLRNDPTGPATPLLREALDRIRSGLPVPG